MHPTFLDRFSKRSNAIVIVILCLACVIIIFVHLITLTKFPPVLIDEPWYANAAWSWLKTGKNFDTMHSIGRESVTWPYLGNIPLVVSFYFFGLGLLQARIISWLFGIFLLITTALVGRKLYGTLTGVLSALLLSISTPYLWSSHYYRPDVMLLSITMLCFLLILIAFDRNKWWAHFLTGFMITVSIDIHQNVVLFGLGFTVLYLYHYRKNILRERGIWLFILGGFFGALYYLTVVVLPHKTDFINSYRFAMGTSHQLPLLTFNIKAILMSARAEIGRFRFFDNSLDFAVIVASIVYLAVRRSKEDRTILLYTGILFAGFVLLIGNKEYEYAIYLYPNFMIISAAAIAALLNHVYSNPQQRAFVFALIGMYFVCTSFYAARSLASHKDYDYYASVAQLKESIPTGARVMGMPEWWFGLYEYDYHSINDLTYLHFLKGDTLTQGLMKVRPDIIIVDDVVRKRLVDNNYFLNEGFELYNMPRAEFDSFLNKYGVKMGEFFIPMHGIIDIYKINWDSG